MILIASLLAVTNFAAVLLLTRHHQHAERAWTEERRELLTRIQRPEQIPMAPMPDFVFPETEPDELELVGTIQELDTEEQ